MASGHHHGTSSVWQPLPSGLAAAGHKPPVCTQAIKANREKEEAEAEAARLAEEAAAKGKKGKKGAKGKEGAPSSSRSGEQASSRNTTSRPGTADKAAPQKPSSRGAATDPACQGWCRSTTLEGQAEYVEGHELFENIEDESSILQQGLVVART